MSLLDIFYDRFLLSTKKKKYRVSGIKDRQVGNTPLIRLFHYSSVLDRLIYAKLESENPTRSAKDRVAEYIISKGIEEGVITEKSTIIEASSGNTGLALARICSLKGLKCIITIKDKVSKNKIEDLLELGAEVIVCDASLPKSDPGHYITKAESLENEIENAFYVNQNFNPDNANAHYHSTGPEIWQQTNGAVTHLVGVIGTGGTLSGTARFLKEQNPDIKVIAIDACGSLLQHYFQKGNIKNAKTHSYYLDGVGKKFIPANVHFQYFDEVHQVSDIDAFNECIELNEHEQLFVGHSSGAVLKGIKLLSTDINIDSCVVGIFPDHGAKYLQSIYSHEWLKDRKFI